MSFDDKIYNACIVEKIVFYISVSIAHHLQVSSLKTDNVLRYVIFPQGGIVIVIGNIELCQHKAKIF